MAASGVAALRQVAGDRECGGREYGELGEQFEDREHDLFGEVGFETVVARVAAMEKPSGRYGPGQFTPKG